MDALRTLLPPLVALVPVLPLLAAAGIVVHVLTGRAAGDAAEGLTSRLARGAALGGLGVLLLLDAHAIAFGAPGTVGLGRWLASGPAAVQLSFLLDPLGLGLATLVMLIAAVTLAFSCNYLHREPGFHRFFIGMQLFVAGMMLILLAGNGVLAFVGWELAGFSSWMLIGYAWDRPTATGNALFAFVTNRIGDAGFLLAICLGFLWLGSAEWGVVAAGPADTVQARLLALGFVVAALAKSAQLPFSAWLGRALEGPTPSSAIFYGAVMVHAGVFLLLRIEPLLVRLPDVMILLAVIGLATALYAWLCAQVQTDVKSALVFATLAQVGLMVAACGLGLFALAAWHLALHAAWRAWQFLMAPSYMHLVSSPAPPVAPWLAGRQVLYTAALQRFWLDPLAQALVVRPAQALGRDARILDEQVLSPLLGHPEDAPAPGDVLAERGLAGRFLAWSAERLHRIEARLLLQPGSGPPTRALRRLGDYLLAVEGLLERPRYLLLLVVATFVVIL